MGLGKTYSTQYLLDSNNSSGVAGQVLSTTSTGIDWVDANTVPGTGLWLANGNDIYNSNSGNVGIGTTSPSHKLEVGLTSSVALASQPAIPLMISNDGQSVDGRVFIQVKNDVVNTASAIGAGFQMTAAGVTSGTASYENSLIFLQSKQPGNQTIHSAPQNIKFYVDNDGTSAGAGANYNDFGDLSFELQTDGDAIFYDNVGIGVTAPAQKLHVGDGGIRVQKSATGLGGFISVGNATESTGNYSAYFFGNTASGTGYFKGGIAYETLASTYGRGDMHFLQNSTTAVANVTISDSVMTILNGGNVGIGTTSPGDVLVVKGGSPGNIDLVSFQNNAGNETHRFYTDSANDGVIETVTNAGVTVNLIQSSGDSYFNGGNVGIGETNPAVPLHISRDNTAAAENIALILDNNATEVGTQIGMLFRCMTGGANTDFEIYGEAKGANTMDLVFESDGSVERMRLKADGDLQIARYLEHLGDTNSYLGWSAADDFRIYTGGRELLRLDEGTDPDVLNFMSTNFSMSTGGELKLLNNGGAKIIFSGNGANPTNTEASVYDQSGVGLTLSAHNVSIRNYDGTNMIESARFVHDKLTCAGDVIAYGSPSDVRLKENIKPIESALDKAMKLQGVTFDWKESDSILNIREDIGFIAQDVQKVLPELVRENSDGMLSMRHQGITPILLEAIKELKAEIDLLKSKPCTCNKCNCNI